MHACRSTLEDPTRIEIRELLKELHRMGKTILISSHILLELADFCTKIGIIERGQMVFTGSVREILERAKVGLILLVGVAEDQAKAVALIKALPGVVSAEPQDGQIRVSLEPRVADPSLIAERLVGAGLRLTRLEEEKMNLETAFMRLTKGLVQ